MTARPPPHEALNRRSYPRKAIRAAATLASGNNLDQVRTWDISDDGICLVTPKPVSPGRRCRLTFAVPLGTGERTVTASIKVVYSSYTGPGSFKIGAVFEALDAETAEAIAVYARTP